VQLLAKRIVEQKSGHAQTAMTLAVKTEMLMAVRLATRSVWVVVLLLLLLLRT
jgi:hypothetical protein